MENKLLQSHYITEGENNLLYVVINLRDKSTEIQYQGDGLFWVWNEEIEVEQTVVEELKFLFGYSVFNSRSKDQAYFLFVPTYQIVEEGRKKEYWKEKLKFS